MSISQCIADILSKDVTDDTEANALTRNPNFGWTLGTVPEYAYKSLGTLWVGPSTSQASLLKRNCMGVWRG